MSKLAPDLEPTVDARKADAALDCRATAALLRAMDTLVWASHVGAIVAAISHAWLALPVWGLVLYFAFRVRLDVEFLELLALNSDKTPERLDQWLSERGLRATRGARSIEDRCRGSRQLAIYMAGAFGAQLLATVAALRL